MSEDRSELDAEQRARLQRLLNDIDTPKPEQPQLPTAAELSSVELPEEAATITTPAPEASEGRMIGPYRIKRIIGSGGMGQVYEAVQDHPRRTVALKVMRGSIDSTAARHRFEFEAQVLARLHHPHIAQIYDAGVFQDEGRELPYFAMEYVAGKPIDEAVRDRKFDRRERLALFVQLCEAVGHGHERGIIHRDLKPGNVLVDRDGRVRVIDFGIARATDSDMRVTEAQTSVGQIVGTIQYMSPEQCAADPNDIDIRSDVYSLGVMLYQLIVNQLPYDLSRTAIHEAVRVVQEVEPTGILTIDRSVAQDIDTIIMKALAKDRGRRYRSAGELGDDIRRYLEDEPILARPPSFSEHLRRYARKHRATTSAVVAVSVAFVLSVVAILFFGLEAQRQRVIAQEQATVAEQQRVIATDALEQESIARATAERHAQLVSTAALDLFGPITARMKNLPEATEARELLVETGFRLLGELQASAAVQGDAAGGVLLGRIALSHEALGDLLGGRRTSNLGRFDQAMEQYEAAESIWRGLRNDAPEAREPAERLALVLNKRADLLFEDAPDAAMVILEESKRINTDLLLRFPESVTAVRGHYLTLERLADTLIEQDKLAAALVLCNEYRDLASMLVERRPDRLEHTRDLAMALRRIGYIRAERQQKLEAAAALARSHELMQAIAAATPDDLRRIADVSWSAWYYGAFLIHNDETDRGAALLSLSAVRMIDALVGDPNVATFRTWTAELLPAICEKLTNADRAESAHVVREAAHIRLISIVGSHSDIAQVLERIESIPTTNRN